MDLHGVPAQYRSAFAGGGEAACMWLLGISIDVWCKGRYVSTIAGTGMAYVLFTFLEVSAPRHL